MSLGLPPTTKIRRTFPKDRLFDELEVSSAVRKRFDSDIHQLTIVDEISERTVNLSPGKDIQMIFVLDVWLNTEDYDARSLQTIVKAIPQNLILSMRSDKRFRLAAFKDVLIQSDWYDEEPSLMLEGPNMDSVWEHLVTQIGAIEVEEGRTLSEQIASDQAEQALREKIARLDIRMKATNQPRRKRELYSELKKLRGELEE